MNQHLLSFAACSALLLSPGMALGQYYGPGNGMVRGPDGKYYPKHLYGRSAMNAVRKFQNQQPAQRSNRMRHQAAQGQRQIAQPPLLDGGSAPEYHAPNLGIY